MLRRLFSHRLRMFRQQNEAAQGVQLLGFALARFSLPRLSPLPVRNLAGDQRGGQKRKQRHPVLRIRNGELPDGRQEKEIEAQHGDDGCQNRFHQSPRRSDAQNIQQVREPGRSRVHRDHPKAEKGRHRDNRQAQRKISEENFKAHR